MPKILSTPFGQHFRTLLALACAGHPRLRTTNFASTMMRNSSAQSGRTTFRTNWPNFGRPADPTGTPLPSCNRRAGKRGPSAMRRGFAFQDPTLGLELPPLESRQITPPTPERVWALIGAAKELGALGYALAYMGAFTGVRRNEALGLRFNDIEWFGNEVNLRHAISKRRGTDGAHKWEWHVGPPKSRKSLRRIAATESVMKMLADLKAGKPDSAFIFPGDCNGFIDPDKFDAEVWKPIAEKAGMADTRFHDLRHFFASQLIGQGETAAYVRDQMGHPSIKVTFDTYGHLFPGRGKEASARYEKSMADARVRQKAEASVSNPLAIDGEEGPEGTVTN